jgi:hypothetical protein
VSPRTARIYGKDQKDLFFTGYIPLPAIDNSITTYWEGLGVGI